jgi:mRNA interferase MazF
MPRADHGSVWIVDLGLVAKVRPCLVPSVATDPHDRVLVTLVPHTTSVQGTRYEFAVQARFPHGDGVFDAQQAATVPQVKLMRKLGDFPPDQLALVEAAVRRWLGLRRAAQSRKMAGKKGSEIVSRTRYVGDSSPVPFFDPILRSSAKRKSNYNPALDPPNADGGSAKTRRRRSRESVPGRRPARCGEEKGGQRGMP